MASAFTALSASNGGGRREEGRGEKMGRACQRCVCAWLASSRLVCQEARARLRTSLFEPFSAASGRSTRLMGGWESGRCSNRRHIGRHVYLMWQPACKRRGRRKSSHMHERHTDLNGRPPFPVTAFPSSVSRDGPLSPCCRRLRQSLSGRRWVGSSNATCRRRLVFSCMQLDASAARVGRGG